MAVEALANGKSVVADNTNPSVAARKMFITRAQKEGELWDIHKRVYKDFFHSLTDLR